MKLHLAENISRLRKENHLTQEQMAEALGVSFAAVSKWERGVATPELALLARIADLFMVSLDALVGYEYGNNQKETMVQTIKNYVHERQAEQALEDVEDALRRYPNCFDIVYYGALNYQVRGIYQQNESYMRKALRLYSRACQLIGQNTDPDISEIEIWKAIASVYIALGEGDKGVAILKAHNPCRINHPLIGQTLATVCDDPQGAQPYLSLALLDLYVAHMQIVIGYINIYDKAKDYEKALLLLQWALAFYPGLKKQDTVSCTDKGESVLWAVRAYIHAQMHDRSQAMLCLRRAKEIARRFDQEPNYNGTSLHFVSHDITAASYDDLGQTAMDGIEKIVADFDNTELLQIWRALRDEA